MSLRTQSTTGNRALAGVPSLLLIGAAPLAMAGPTTPGGLVLMQAERTPLTDEDVALWTERAKALAERAIGEIVDGDDAIPTLSAAMAALKIAEGTLSPEELWSWFPEDEPEPPCICPPELLARGGYKGRCPRHSLVR